MDWRPWGRNSGIFGRQGNPVRDEPGSTPNGTRLMLMRIGASVFRCAFPERAEVDVGFGLVRVAVCRRAFSESPTGNGEGVNDCGLLDRISRIHRMDSRMPGFVSGRLGIMSAPG